MSEKSDLFSGLVDSLQTGILRSIFLGCQVRMISCVNWKNRPPWFVNWRTCPDSFLLFPVKGGFRVTVKGGTYDVEPGEFLMIPENTGHRIEILESCSRLEQFSLHCHIHDRWGQPLLARFGSVIGRLPSLELWKQHLTELTSIFNSENELGQMRGAALIRELLAAQWNQGVRMEPMPKARDHRVSVVMQSMKQNLASPSLSVEDLAAEVHLTATRLRTLFVRDVGMAPKQFVNRLRLQEAARLLCQTESSIKEIAAACGFASDHYFHLVFRRGFGCTPSDYRRRLLNEV